MAEFWNNKYATGGISGKGSIGVYRNWKWNQIAHNCGMDFRSLVDVGCGDLSFWNHPVGKKIRKRKGFKYTGIDVSDEIINRNRKAEPKFDFVCAPAHIEQPGLNASVVLCLDLLFHIMGDSDYSMTLETICRYANKYLVIYSWRRNPFDGSHKVTDGISQYFRRLGLSKHIFLRNDMQLINSIDVPFDPYGKIYFFRRVIY